MIKTTLGQVADIITGPFGSSLHQYEYVSFGIPVIMPQDIGNRNLSCEKIAYITQEKANELSRYLVDTNDIVYARRGDIEKHAFITDNDKGAICGTGCLRVRIMDKNVNPLFLSFYLNKPETKKWISLHAVGSSMPNINSEILSKVPIVLPDKREQDSIASFLDNIDNKISNNNDICSDLESMAKLLYDYWFVQFDFPDENGKPYKSSGGKMVWNEELKREIPDGWEVSTLKGKYDIKRGISYTSKDIESGDGTPMINLACIDIKRNYRDGEIKYYNGNVTPENLLSPNDLLIACTDLTRNADIVGSPILTPNDGNTYTFSMDIAKLIPNEAELNPIYLYMALRTEYYHKYIKRWASGTNVLHLDLTGLDWYKMWFPPKALQDRFADAIISFEERKHKTMVENQELASLRDFLLPMLMNGQVKVKKEDDNE